MTDEQIVKDLIKKIKDMTPEEIYENDIKVAKSHPEVFMSLTSVIMAVLELNREIVKLTKYIKELPK